MYQPTEGSYTNIKNWTHLETAKGTLVAHVDDSWYPEPIKDNALNKSWSMYFFIVGADEDYQAQLTLIPSQLNFFPGPQVFTLLRTVFTHTLVYIYITNDVHIIEIARNTTTTIPTQSSNPLPDSPRNVPVTNNSSDTSKKLPGWAIAVIVISSLLFIAAVAALIWAYKRYQKRSKRRSMMALGPNITTGDDEKLPVLTPTKNESHVAASTSINAAAAAAGTAGLLAAAASATKSRSGADISSIHSSTQQLWSPRSLSPRQDEVSFSSEKPPLGLHSEAHQSSSILSSTDALMIADTFRQFMRKPEWNEEMELNAQQQKEEKGGSEEEERKRLGDELLVRQLKKEGTQVKEINKFN